MDLEKTIIAEILSEPELCGHITEVLTPDMFSGENIAIYKAIHDIYEEGGVIDLFSVAKKARIDKLTTLTEITMLASSSSALNSHAYSLKEKHVLRTIDRYSMQLNSLISAKESAQYIIDYAQSGMEDIIEMVSSARGGFEHISKVIERAVQEAESRVAKRRNGESIGVTTGLRPLDRVLHFMRGGQLIVVASRPAMGKTALTLHFARSAARAGHNVCMYQLEMSSVSLADRMLFSIADIDTYAYKTGDFHEWDKVMVAQSELSKLPIYIDDKPQVSMSYIRNHSRIMKKKGKCDIIYIDYLQLIDTDDRRNREQEVAKITRRCKVLAKELDVPVVILAQINREAESDRSKRPELKHLRESGAIEQDADVVLFPYRAAYYKIDTIEVYDKYKGKIEIPSTNVMEIIVAKNRDGAIADIAISHNENLTRFDNLNL